MYIRAANLYWFRPHTLYYDAQLSKKEDHIQQILLHRRPVLSISNSFVAKKKKNLCTKMHPSHYFLILLVSRVMEFVDDNERFGMGGGELLQSCRSYYGYSARGGQTACSVATTRDVQEEPRTKTYRDTHITLRVNLTSV